MLNINTSYDAILCVEVWENKDMYCVCSNKVEICRNIHAVVTIWLSVESKVIVSWIDTRKNTNLEVLAEKTRVVWKRWINLATHGQSEALSGDSVITPCYAKWACQY
jgi:hypothetical protein